MSAPNNFSISFRDEYQRRIYDEIIKFINNPEKSTLLISAPPGTGKTYITITALLNNFNGRIVVVLRTHTQQEHYKKILPMEEYLALRGMESFCKIPQVIYHPLKHQLCQWMRRMGKCKGCLYQYQFIEAKRKRVISLLYSHLSTPLHDLLNSAEIIIFDEYQNLIPNEKTLNWTVIQLAEAELGSKIDLNSKSSIIKNLATWKELGLKIWSKKGYSYLLELSNILSSLLLKNTWIYKKGENYGYLDVSAYEYALKLPTKKIFISATPLPEINGLLSYDQIVEITPTLKNVLFLIFDAFSLPYYKRYDKKVREVIIKLVDIVSTYRSAIFLPSKTVKDLLFKKLPSNITEDIKDFMNNTNKSALLIAGGKYSEAIDLPNLDIITIVGIPYEEPIHINPGLKQLFKYYKLYNVKVRRLFYDYKAILKVIQAIGRGIRRVDQRLLVIFADKRYTEERIFDLFPTWLKSQVFLRIDDFDILKELIIRWNLKLPIKRYFKMLEVKDLLKRKVK